MPDLAPLEEAITKARAAISVSFVADGAGALVAFGDPARSNAFDDGTVESLIVVLDALDAADDLWSIGFLGNGDQTFTAGYDLKALVAGGRDKVLDNAMPRLGKRIAASSKLTFALINGAVSGSGIHMIASCDVRLAIEGTRFLMPAAKLGVMYDPDAIEHITTELGPAIARRLLLAGETLTATELASSGFVSTYADRAQLITAFESKVAKVTSASPIAIAAMKRAISHRRPNSLILRQLQIETADTADHAEAMRAIANKCAPNFRIRKLCT
jgi:enoyl-CoA hydratase/carnithine racemase